MEHPVEVQCLVQTGDTGLASTAGTQPQRELLPQGRRVVRLSLYALVPSPSRTTLICRESCDTSQAKLDNLTMFSFKECVPFEHQIFLWAMSSWNTAQVTSIHSSNCSQMMQHAVCPGMSNNSSNICVPVLTSKEDHLSDTPHGAIWHKRKPELRFQARMYPNLAMFMMFVPKAKFK